MKKLQRLESKDSPMRKTKKSNTEFRLKSSKGGDSIFNKRHSKSVDPRQRAKNKTVIHINKSHLNGQRSPSSLQRRLKKKGSSAFSGLTIETPKGDSPTNKSSKHSRFSSIYAKEVMPEQPKISSPYLGKKKSDHGRIPSLLEMQEYKVIQRRE